MKLISCHIANFGRLHDLDLSFTDGLNTYLKENGAGKSTLAAFIRVMFYGLSGERKTEESENDRKRYMPWQGGVFGGQLTFTTRTKSYRIERVFGERKSQDRFTLYNAETNLASQDYTENIGAELFQMDEESFRNTIFIGQQAVASSVTSDIHAKIGNVEADADDMGQYARVSAKLRDEINAVSPNRRTGSIFRLRLELEKLEGELKPQKELEARMEHAGSTLCKAREQSIKLSRDIEEIQRRFQALSRYQDLASEKAQYDRIREEIEELRAELEADLERCFSGADSEMSEEDKLRQASIELNRLTQTFEHGFPTEEDLQRTEKELLRVRFLNERELKLLQEYKHSPGKKLSIYRLLPGVLLVMAGIVLLVLTSQPMPGALVLGIGIVSMLLGAASHPASGVNEDISERETRISHEIARLNGKVNRFLGGFYPDFDYPGAEQEELETGDTGEDELERRHPNRFVLLRKLGRDLIRYHRLSDLNVCEQKLYQKTRERDSFEGSHDVSRYAGLKKPAGETESLAGLSRILTATTEQRNHAADVIRATGGEITELQQRLTELSEKERTYQAKKGELSELEKRYALLVLTRDHLAAAKEKFSGAYMEPLMQAFRKYYQMMTGSEDVPYRMDADYNLILVSDGASHTTSTLSDGCQDLVSICRRMAWIEAMYPEEHPFILLDDPFVNLDEDKLRRAIRFLNCIAEEYQILYFTCHESRR
jgi:DNA repair exonuclease SbcCD ATPase subunit